MLFLLRLGLAVVASAPDAGGMELSEPLQAVASCPLPFRLDDTEQPTAKFVETGGTRAIHITQKQESGATSGSVVRKEWLVMPGTCRRMVLRVECPRTPDCSAQLLHASDPPPTDTERELLESWLGGDKSDPRRPEHQSALVGPLALLPEPPEAEPSEDEEPSPPSKKAPAPITARAVMQPSPNWLKGPPVPQARSWSRSDVAQEPPLDAALKGFVSSGPAYSLHRGDKWVRVHSEGEVWKAGLSRIRFIESLDRWKPTYVVLEQPKRDRSAWLLLGHRSKPLGVHQGRAWLEQPAFLDSGFTLLAIDLDTGAAWHLALNAAPTFDPLEYRAARVTPRGLLLESAEEKNRKTRLVPWTQLEQALREARPPTR